MLVPIDIMTKQPILCGMYSYIHYIYSSLYMSSTGSEFICILGPSQILFLLYYTHDGTCYCSSSSELVSKLYTAQTYRLTKKLTTKFTGIYPREVCTVVFLSCLLRLLLLPTNTPPGQSTPTQLLPAANHSTNQPTNRPSH